MSVTYSLRALVLLLFVFKSLAVSITIKVCSSYLLLLVLFQAFIDR